MTSSLRVDVPGNLVQVIEFDQEGFVSVIYTVDNLDRKQGQYLGFLQGKLEEKLSYKDNTLNGLCEWFDGKGQVAERGFYKNGEPAQAPKDLSRFFHNDGR